MECMPTTLDGDPAIVHAFPMLMRPRLLRMSVFGVSQMASGIGIEC